MGRHGSKSIYTRFRRWAARTFTALLGQDIVDGTALMLDSTTIKAHQHGAPKKGKEAVGRSCGGLTTKVYAGTEIQKLKIKLSGFLLLYDSKMI